MGACSTMRPAYITATRSQISAMTPRSCVIADAHPVVALKVAQKRQDLSLDGHVECGRRLVGDQQFRTR